MWSPKAKIWGPAPEPAIPNPPATFFDGSRLVVAYEIAPPKCGEHAIACFDGVIEFVLTSVNDEGLGRHRYANAGLQFYSFHEIVNATEVARYKALAPRMWVVTYKDNTLDVLARSLDFVSLDAPGTSAAQALASWLKQTSS